MISVLDNPLWSSLTGEHSHFAAGGELLKVYPWEMVPFAAVSSADVTLTDELLDETIGDRPYVYFVGTLPRVDARKYEFARYDDIVQMVCGDLRPMPDASVDARELTTGDVPAMIDLTQRVYPAYFRERTIEMGPYLGVFDGRALVAMAGLRMAPTGYRELSGVCTDPLYAGRGNAKALCARLAERVVAEGKTPMLHFDADNASAQRLYESLGFSIRTMIPMCRVSRAGERPRTEVHHESQRHHDSDGAAQSAPIAGSRS